MNNNDNKRGGVVEKGHMIFKGKKWGKEALHRYKAKCLEYHRCQVEPERRGMTTYCPLFGGI